MTYRSEVCRNAIAKFLFNCANDIHTSFGCLSSTSYMDNIYYALVEEYGYNAYPPVRRGSDDIAWIGRIKSDIDNGEPVIYRGADTHNQNGHFFILDGYDSDGRFHINWGWGNSFQNFYVHLGNFAPGSSNYNYFHWAIFKLSAPSFGEYCHQELYLSDFYSSYYANGSSGQAYAIIPQTMTRLISASSSSPSSWRTIPANTTAIYQAHKEIILEDGFEAQAGCEFEARIESCARCGNNRYDATDGEERPIDNVGEFSFDMTVDTTYVVGSSEESIITDLFPNPTDGPLTMATDGMAEAVFIHDFVGRPVGGWHLDALTESFVTLDVSALRPGAYLLTVTTSTGTRTARFVRR